MIDKNFDPVGFQALEIYVFVSTSEIKAEKEQSDDEVSYQLSHL